MNDAFRNAGSAPMVRNAPPVRLAFALGSWQLVALDAALRAADADAAGRAEPAARDVLVLYETGPASAELVAAMRDVSAAVRRWHQVVDAFALMPGVHRKITQREFDTLRERLRRAVGVERVDELWLCRVTRAAERLVMEAWPDARVVLYEDGVLSYLPMAEASAGDASGDARARWRALLDAARPVWRFRRGKNALDPRHRDRIADAWMLLADRFAPPRALAGARWHTVPAETLREVVAACEAIPAVARVAAAPAVESRARPRLLVLGQALSRYHALERADEEGAYVVAVRRIVSLGYDVVWKEHPRATEPFFAAVAAGHPEGRVRELALPFALPVELVAGRLGLAGCVGGITTALFYLPRLFGIAAFSFSDAFAGKLRGDWALQNELFISRIAPLRALPEATDAAYR